MDSLTPSQKGAIAETALAASVIELGFVVLRPLCEGTRYDLLIDLEPRLLRVQCKWAAYQDGVLRAHTFTSRHTPRGYVRTKYKASEVDAIAAYCQTTRKSYLVPIDHVELQAELRLRVRPTKNNQAALVRWAADYELEYALRRYWGADTRRIARSVGDTMLPHGAIAQLGER